MSNFLKTCAFVCLIGLTACTGGASAKQDAIGFAALQGKTWRLLSIKTPSGDTGFSRSKLEAEDMGDFYILQFDSERVSGRAAPNRYSATYKREGDHGVSFNTIVGTRMASFKEPEDLKEQAYYDYLAQVTGWALVQGRLELYTRDMAGMEAVLIFGTE